MDTIPSTISDPRLLPHLGPKNVLTWTLMWTNWSNFIGLLKQIRFIFVRPNQQAASPGSAILGTCSPRFIPIRGSPEVELHSWSAPRFITRQNCRWDGEEHIASALNRWFVSCYVIERNYSYGTARSGAMLAIRDLSEEKADLPF